MIWCNVSASNTVRASKCEPKFQIKRIKPNICYFWICQPCSGCLRSLLSGKRENNWEKLSNWSGGVKTEHAGFSLSSRVEPRFKFWIRSVHVVCASLIERSNYAPFSKKRGTTSNPPPPSHLNLSPRLVLLLNQRYSQLTVKNEPLGDITRSDVKDVAANNSTRQLFNEVVPRRKVARLIARFYTFPPYILFKRRHGTRQFYPTKFIKWVPKPGPTQFYCTYKHRLELFTKWCHWKAVCGGSLWKWPSSTTFKNADPGTFSSLFFLLSTEHSHFDYLNIFTCTSAVIDIPFADIYQNIKI